MDLCVFQKRFNLISKNFGSRFSSSKRIDKNKESLRASCSIQNQNPHHKINHTSHRKSFELVTKGIDEFFKLAAPEPVRFLRRWPKDDVVSDQFSSVPATTASICALHHGFQPNVQTIGVEPDNLFFDGQIPFTSLRPPQPPIGEQGQLRHSSVNVDPIGDYGGGSVHFLREPV